MTAQAGERLFYKGEENWMATEPLSQYLHNRNDVNFVSHSTACWRGYYGQWEINDRKLYLIDLKAYLKGYREVGLNYLFPGQNRAFANWFNGDIRIPQGEMLEYVHMGYASLYERDLILVFENGLLTNEYIINNHDEYQNRKEKLEKKKIDQDAKKKKNDKITTAIYGITISITLIGIIMALYYLIKQKTPLTNLYSALIIIPIIFIIGGLIFYIANKGENRSKEDKIVAFTAINLIVLVFICICIGLFYLFKWGTMTSYFISTIVIITLLYLIFIAVKNQREKKKC